MGIYSLYTMIDWIVHLTLFLALYVFTSRGTAKTHVVSAFGILCTGTRKYIDFFILPDV